MSGLFFLKKKDAQQNRNKERGEPLDKDRSI